VTFDLLATFSGGPIAVAWSASSQEHTAVT